MWMTWSYGWSMLVDSRLTARWAWTNEKATYSNLNWQCQVRAGPQVNTILTCNFNCFEMVLSIVRWMCEQSSIQNMLMLISPSLQPCGIRLIVISTGTMKLAMSCAMQWLIEVGSTRRQSPGARDVGISPCPVFPIPSCTEDCHLQGLGAWRPDTSHSMSMNVEEWLQRRMLSNP